MGCLRAIGIYAESSGKLTKINSSEKSDDQLKILEQTSLQKFSLQSPENKVDFYPQQYEYHYIKKDLEANAIIAIVSKSELSKFILFNFYTNIRHILAHPPLGLDQIVDEPLNYMGQNYFKIRAMDDKIENIQKTLAETKQVMVENIDLVIARHEKIQTLIEKSEVLKLDAEDFNLGAKKLNRCCRWV